MKKFLVLLALLLALPAAGQTVGASQIKKKANAGLVADSVNAMAVGVYRGTSAPASPVTGQLWLDTTGTPATLKTYNGSTWEITPPNNALPTKTNTDEFPANPVDGQLVWDKNLHIAYVYDEDDAVWRRLIDGRQVSGSYTLPTSATVITAPSAGPTLTFTSGGSATAGSHECVYTYVNSTGGETTVSPSSGVISTGSNYTYSLTGVTTGGTGTVARRVYCSKNGVAGVWYWIGQISDNTTTAVTYTTADSGITLPAPTFNFSGPMHSGWTCTNCSQTSGGCGTASDGAIGCKTNTSGGSGATTDTQARAAYSLASWGAGLVIEARVVAQGHTIGNPSGGTTNNHVAAGLRTGNLDTAQVLVIGNANYLPVTTSYPVMPMPRSRNTAGGSLGTATSVFTFPGIYTTAWLFRLVRETSQGFNRWQGFATADAGVSWTAFNTGNSFTSPYAFYQFDSTQFEVSANHAGGTGSNYYSECRVDSIRIWPTGL